MESQKRTHLKNKHFVSDKDTKTQWLFFLSILKLGFESKFLLLSLMANPLQDGSQSCLHIAFNQASLWMEGKTHWKKAICLIVLSEKLQCKKIISISTVQWGHLFLQHLLTQKHQSGAPKPSSSVARVFKDKLVLFKNPHPYNLKFCPWFFGHDTLSSFC